MRAAIAVDMIVIIILTIASIAVLATFVFSLPLRSVSFSSNAACQGVSFIGRISSAIGGIDFSHGSIDPTGADQTKLCPAQLVTISDRTSDKQVVSTIANQMALCQRNYGAGKTDLFAQDKSQKDLYCVLCSYIDFKNDNKALVTGLSEYLVSHQVPGMKESYAQYLGSVGTNDLTKGVKLPEYTLSRAYDYGIFYFYGKQTSFYQNKIQATVTGGAKGAAIGGGTTTAIFVGAITTGGEVGTFFLPGVGTAGGAVVGVTVGALIIGTSTLIGAIIGSLSHTGDKYVGATVLVPWDKTSFDANHLKCDQIRGIP